MLKTFRKMSDSQLAEDVATYADFGRTGFQVRYCQEHGHDPSGVYLDEVRTACERSRPPLDRVGSALRGLVGALTP